MMESMKEVDILCTIRVLNLMRDIMKITDMRVIGAGLLGILAGLYFDLIYTWENVSTPIVLLLSVVGLLATFFIIQMIAKNDQEVSKFLFVVFFITFAITFIITWIIYLI